MTVPFFRPDLEQDEIDEVVAVLRSGWLTTGPRVRRFEEAFASSVGARHAVAVNSCTAALHLAVEVLGLRSGQPVLVPTMTFAATAEVIRYLDAIPVLVDCDPHTFHLDLEDAERKVAALAQATAFGASGKPVGLMAVHVGGLMMDLERLHGFARRHDLWIIEDAAHSFPAAWRQGPDSPWRRCGEDTADISCFSFYANKTLITGEGGMAVTASSSFAERMRSLSLHGLTHDAWGRYTAKGSWDYRIVAPGYKYNLTDIAAALGIHQLARAEQMRRQREKIAHFYRESLGDLEEIELPEPVDNRIHAWHLFQIALRLERLAIDRDDFLQELKNRGIGFSVHWRPLHLHPYYEETFGWRPEDLPVASYVWKRTISLPIFPSMSEKEQVAVCDAVREICVQSTARSRAREIVG